MNTTFSTKQFTFVKDTFVADITDLGPKAAFRKVHPDVLEPGIILVSHKTGRAIAFYIVDGIRDPHGRLIGYFLKPIPQEVEKDPSIANLRIEILND